MKKFNRFNRHRNIFHPLKLGDESAKQTESIVFHMSRDGKTVYLNSIDRKWNHFLFSFLVSHSEHLCWYSFNVVVVVAVLVSTKASIQMHNRCAIHIILRSQLLTRHTSHRLHTWPVAIGKWSNHFIIMQELSCV